MIFTRTLLVSFAVLFAALPAAGQETPPPATPQEIDLAEVLPGMVPSVETHSGAPLLLEVHIPDPAGIVTSVHLAGPSSSASYQIEPDPEREAVDLTISPFLEPGTYDVTIRTEVRAGEETGEIETALQVAFVDFVFGRDNLKFGNNAEYESVIGTYGEILEEWLESRFGEVDTADIVPLVDYMYHFFGERSGRCYAFSGSELRFWLWPDLLPSYYDETYDLFGTVSATQREINFLQLDMAFDHFLTGGYDLSGVIAEDPEHGTRETIMEEIRSVTARIESGQPVVVGFIGPQLHHAMLAYGFINHADSDILDLVVANNWKSEQDLNLRSLNAETMRIHMNPDHEGSMFEWRYPGGTRSREINRLFIVEVKREYAHDREVLDAVVAARRGLLEERRRAVVLVEDAAGAWLTDGEKTTGYKQRRTLGELDGVVLDRVGRTYRFEYPADGEMWLELDDDEGARILHFRPGPEPGAATAWIGETEEPEDGATIRRGLSLDTGDELPEVIAGADE